MSDKKCNTCSNFINNFDKRGLKTYCKLYNKDVNFYCDFNYCYKPKQQRDSKGRFVGCTSCGNMDKDKGCVARVRKHIPNELTCTENNHSFWIQKSAITERNNIYTKGFFMDNKGQQEVKDKLFNETLDKRNEIITNNNVFTNQQFDSLSKEMVKASKSEPDLFRVAVERILKEQDKVLPFPEWSEKCKRCRYSSVNGLICDYKYMHSVGKDFSSIEHCVKLNYLYFRELQKEQNNIISQEKLDKLDEIVSGKAKEEIVKLGKQCKTCCNYTNSSTIPFKTFAVPYETCISKCFCYWQEKKNETKFEVKHIENIVSLTCQALSNLNNILLWWFWNNSNKIPQAYAKQLSMGFIQKYSYVYSNSFQDQFSVDPIIKTIIIQLTDKQIMIELVKNNVSQYHVLIENN